MIQMKTHDIVKKREGEERKESSGEFTEAPSLLIVGLDSNGEVIFCNKECEKLIGINGKEIVGKHFWDLSPDKDEEKIKEHFGSKTLKNLPSSYEMPWLSDTGEVHKINWEIIQFRESKEKIRAIICAGIDVTEYEKTEGRIRKLEKINQKLISQNIIGVYMIEPTPEGIKLLSYNPKFRSIFGIEDEELEENFETLISTDHISLLENKVQEAKKGNKEVTFEVKGEDKEEEEDFWIKNRLIPLTYEEESILLGMVQDIDMEKKAQENRMAEEKYRAIVDFAQVGIGIIQDEKIVYLNDQIAKNFECSKEELRNQGFIHFIHPDDREKIETSLRKEIPDRQLPFSTEYKAITKEGRVKYLSLHATKIEYEGSQATQIIIQDETEQKETEKRLRDQRAELRQAYKYLREAESELAEKTDELERVNEMRARFMDLLAHELRSYLTPVNTYVGAIKTGELGDVTTMQRKKLEEAEKKLKKINQLVEDTLDLSRMEAGRVEASEESIFLPDMIEGIIDDLEPEIENKNHELITEIPEDLPVIEGDPRLLDKVFRNLISNAIKYTPEGGKITVDLSKADDGIHAKVSDNGIGIPKEDQEKIFEKFYRVEEDSKDEPRGLGMGLTVSKHFLELHDGEIWVESTRGEGSTFHVKLPKTSSQ